jgi:hypothetical protein
MYKEMLGSLSRQSPEDKANLALRWRARLLDTVAVKGKKQGVKIYALRRSVAADTEKAWLLSDQGMNLYYKRDFKNAAARFQAVLGILPGDISAANHLEACKQYMLKAPAADWDGVRVMTSK